MPKAGIEYLSTPLFIFIIDCINKLYVVLLRSGDVERHEGQTGGPGEGEREAAGQEGAIQGASAVSYSVVTFLHLECYGI